MRNKGAIKVFAIAMALVSIYQLSFTWKTNQINKAAQEYAQGDKARLTFYKDSLSGEPVYNFLGLKKYTYRECQEREFNLGLDLKGGMNVTLEVSVVDLINSLANFSTDTTFTSALVLAKKLQTDSQDDFVTLFGQAFETVDPNGNLSAIFNTIELRDRIQYNSTNAEVLDVIREETDVAIDNSVLILRNRIDQFGVAQPNFQELGTKGRVLIELPGIKDQKRVRKLLQGAAKLEIWETYENSELWEFFLSANEKIKELNDIESGETESVDEAVVEEENVTAEADTATSLIDQLESDTTALDDQSSLEEFAKNFPLFAVLKPASTGDQLYTGPTVGFSHFRDTAKVNHYLSIPQVKAVFPTNVRFYWTADPLTQSKETYELVAIKVTNREGKPALDGSAISRASDGFDAMSKPEVSLTMDAEGGRVWQRLTKENIGRHIAIVLDNYVRSKPVVNSEISGGRTSISGGGMTINDAQDLANVLKSGKMDAPAIIIQEEVVGPSLGREAIQSGLLSFIIAFLLVLLYMIFYYNRAGFVANLALVVNVFFIMGVLASLGAVLTLPGIAGIVLTIGMSVDANVLIFERIREELLSGKNLKIAIKDGYKNAYSAIIDANFTTLLTGIILIVVGTGPIRGFATTLVIGIFTSLFSAIFITRLIFENWLGKDKKISFSTKLTEGAFKNLNVKFLEKRKIFYYISTALILVSIVSLSTRKLNLGVDFSGGRTYVVRFENPVSTEDITVALSTPFGSEPQVKTYGGDSQVKITTKFLIDSDDPNADEVVETALYDGLKSFLPADVSIDEFLYEDTYIQNSHLVGPTIADDIIKSAIISIILALFGIFLYILLRFRTWQFGLGAVAALFHDVIIVLGVFSLLYSIMPFSLEIDQAFIAAILTVVGYSINDTVVVFDRVREYVGLYRKRERKLIIDQALNSTLSRTFSTSLSTFVVLLAIFIFGGVGIRGFIFAMMIGVIVGTYSSLFIASPIVYDLVKKEDSSSKDKAIKGKTNKK
ncbi:MAG: protein translocase subunit SecDF [Bacteroidales bacterium]|nr:protein translocase subunit SecDF [Bacteroidales bacterium]